MQTLPTRLAWLFLGVLLLSSASPRAYAQTPDDSTYTVREGDTLFSIAQRFGVSVEAIQRWNDLESTNVKTGQALRIRPVSASRTASEAASDSTYTVRKGDTLFSIAQRFGVSVRTLQSWNDLEGASIQVGQTLRVRPPDSASSAEEPDPETTADTARRTASSDTTARPSSSVEPPVYGRYTTSPGDSFVDLALRTGTTADTLLALNDSTTTSLSPNRTLRLPKRFAPPAYVVKEGETIFDIAGLYGVSVRALREVNRLDTTTVEAGRRLRIPGRDAPPIPDAGLAPPDTTGPLAVYPSTYAGRLMSSGATYDPNSFVGAHPSLPYGSLVLLTNPATGQHTFVRIADRGPLDASFLMDVSAAAARQLDLPSDPSNQPVAFRVVWVNE